MILLPYFDVILVGVKGEGSIAATLAQRNVQHHDDQSSEGRPSQNFQGVELQRMDDADRVENRFGENRV